MAIQINGSGTISGISSGGINDDVVDAGTIAANSRMVLEQFLSPCDGSVIALQDGNHTLANVTAEQNLSTSYADVTGSSFTYTPPAGTTQVIYEFHGMHGSEDDIWPIPHFRLYLDSDEVVYQRKTVTARDYFEGQWYYRYAFNIGGTADTNTGRVASWTSAKTIKIQAREYSSGYDVELNRFDHWDGGAGPIFNQPIIGITAIG